MYLLDTDTIIYIIKGNDRVKHNLELRLNDPIKTSVISLMELYYGAHKSQRVSSNLAKIRKIEHSLEIVPIDTGSVEIFGRLKAEYELQGKRLDDFDLAIAACALTNRLTLVTNNEKHFKRIEGLQIENWTQ